MNILGCGWYRQSLGPVKVQLRVVGCGSTCANSEAVCRVSACQERYTSWSLGRGALTAFVGEQLHTSCGDGGQQLTGASTTVSRWRARSLVTSTHGEHGRPTTIQRPLQPKFNAILQVGASPFARHRVRWGSWCSMCITCHSQVAAEPVEFQPPPRRTSHQWTRLCCTSYTVPTKSQHKRSDITQTVMCVSRSGISRQQTPGAAACCTEKYCHAAL